VLDHGYTMIPDVLDADECQNLTAAIAAAVAGSGGSSGNLRNLMHAVPAVRDLARSDRLLQHVAAFLGRGAFPVRALLFDKTPAANWSLGWHQDLAIAVKERHDAPGFSGWSVKAGVTHVLPPTAVLEQMLAARLHLDDCDASNGALRVLPGSHREGRLEDAAVTRWSTAVSAVTCAARRGDVLLLRPLLLHSSAQAATPRHRRVIHIEYAAGPLPDGVEWFEPPGL